MTWQTKGTQIWLCKCRAAERLDRVPGEKTTEAQAEPTLLETREWRGEIGRAGGEGRSDHRETEKVFLSSSWEILPVSLQPVRTVTHDSP